MALLPNFFIELRMKRLLSRGYFPSELPTPFTTESFGSRSNIFRAAWKTEDIDGYRTSAEDYSIPRYGHARRKLSIVNPINQFRVAELISENWKDIRDRIKRSTISEFDPKITFTGRRAVNGVDFLAVSARRAAILAEFGRYVKTDITRFYPSIYTHSIAWALLGKEYYKANYKDPVVKGHFANSLDKAIAAGQQGQTSGIPIGPDTSRIISELIATEIEVLSVGNGLNDLSRRAVRYVDDIMIGLKSEETPAAALTSLSAALYDYQLELSAEKTTTHGVGVPHAPEWLNFIRSASLTANVGRQQGELDSYFNQIAYLADQNPRDNVLLFGVKRVVTFAVHDENVGHLVRWLLYCARREASCLGFIAEHLAALSLKKQLPTELIQDFILEQLIKRAEVAHISEVAWLLFWARETDIVIPAAVANTLTNLRSSVVAILLHNIHKNGKTDGVIDLSYWASFASVAGLKSSMWLASYELSRKGWWAGKVSTKYVSSEKYFGDLWDNNVSFYDEASKARLTVTPSFDAPPAMAFDIGFGEYPP